MRKVIIALMLVSIEASAQIKYPETRKTNQVDSYFGTEVKDPYRWLEDDNSVETGEWVKAQNKVTQEYLSQIPYRDKIQQRLTQLWNFPKEGAPFKKKQYLFYYKNDGIQNQNVLYVKEGYTGNPRVLLDPNKESFDGTVSVTATGISNDARYLAYSSSKGGSDWNTISVIEISTGKKIEDESLKWVKFSGISWFKDGFYYSRYSAPEKGKEYSTKNEFHKIYYHKIGDKQEKDKLIYEDKNYPQRNFTAKVTDDEKILVINGSESTSGMSLLFKDLTEEENPIISLVADFKSDFGLVDHNNGKLFIHTNRNAPKFKVVAIDLKNPSESKWIDVVAEGKDLLEGVSSSKDKLICRYLKDVSTRLVVFNMNGTKAGDIALPGLGMVNEFNASDKSDTAYYTYTTFTAPTSVFGYDLKAKRSWLIFKPEIDFKSEEYETRQVFYKSKDGTEIPMFITSKKGLELNGSNPCFLFGYGGFNISYTPEFRIDRAVFLENGGVYAVANLRGGGEYGEEWHEAGTKLNKQNVFDDFIAATDYLVNNKYTNREKLAIHGRSNGGLLIGAVITQRPDIAKVAIPTVGVLDMLRYHKFTIGWAWATDYGNSEDETQFRNLIKYSPLQNVKEAAYPATLILTGDHDDRVVPAHSFKFAATLQEKQKGTNPTLIRIDTNAGHGSGKPTSKQIEEFADMWSFVFFNLEMKL